MIWNTFEYEINEKTIEVLLTLFSEAVDFVLKNTASEIYSILRMIFLNMFLNSDFTNSTEDEILSKIHT